MKEGRKETPGGITSDYFSPSNEAAVVLYSFANRCSSMGSRRRSPRSIFDTADCPQRNALATSIWERPAVFRAFFRRWSNSRYDRVKTLFGGMARIASSCYNPN